MLLSIDALDLVVAKDHGFHNHLTNCHLETSFFVFCDFSVYEDAVHKVVEDSFSQQELGEIKIVIESFRSGVWSLVSNSELLIKSSENSLSDFWDGNHHVSLENLLKIGIIHHNKSIVGNRLSVLG